MQPDEVIVIDNESTDNTRQLVKSISDAVSFPIRHHIFTGVGYPTIYNAGLNSATYQYVAFIDDDCIADIGWLESIKESLQKNPTAAAVMGWCETYYDSNVYSQATVLLTNEWKRRSISGKRVTDCEVLDNKNVVYNREFLVRHNLEYDEERVKYSFGAAEDCDLGMQIQQAGGNVAFNSYMLIWHKDPRDWLWFMKKNIASWHAYNSLKHKWDLESRERYKKPYMSLIDVVSKFAQMHSLTAFQQFRLFFVIKQVLVLSRLLTVLDRLQRLR